MNKKFPSTEELNRDLGLGQRVAQQSRSRFLNQDGTFNVRREGLSVLRSLSVYQALLTMSWVKFYLLIIAGYFATNLAFAMGYLATGVEALHGTTGTTPLQQFLESFFFSVQTLATIGYGRISPAGLTANILVTVEALLGLMGFSLATGLLFARFSRPDVRMVFSRNAVIAPYRGITGFEFRIANERTSQLIEVEVTVVMSRNEMQGGKTVRTFHALPLERKKVMFLPLHLVVVHPIDEQSPLFGVTPEKFDASEAEFMILISGVDETFSQTVHTRSSYRYDEVMWGYKFSDIYLPADGGIMGIDMRRIHDMEKV